MKYNQFERIDIGKQIYNGELTCQQAAIRYSISVMTAKRYLKSYRIAYSLPPKYENPDDYHFSSVQKEAAPTTLEGYERMTKEELIQELILSKINEERAKKGYAVKGVGAQKEYIPLDSKNTKS